MFLFWVFFFETFGKRFSPVLVFLGDNLVVVLFSLSLFSSKKTGELCGRLFGGFFLHLSSFLK